MEMAVRLMETAETVMETDGDGSGGRLLSPKIHWWRWRSYRTVLEISLTPLGFSIPRLYIGEGASSGGCQGTLTIGRHGQGLGRAPFVCGRPLAPLRLSFGLWLSWEFRDSSHGVA
jgi:hypothetical protein